MGMGVGKPVLLLVLLNWSKFEFLADAIYPIFDIPQLSLVL